MVAYANTFSRSFLYLPAKIQQLFETRNSYEEKVLFFTFINLSISPMRKCKTGFPTTRTSSKKTAHLLQFA